MTILSWISCFNIQLKSAESVSLQEISQHRSRFLWISSFENLNLSQIVALPEIRVCERSVLQKEINNTFLAYFHSPMYEVWWTLLSGSYFYITSSMKIPHISLQIVYGFGWRMFYCAFTNSIHLRIDVWGSQTYRETLIGLPFAYM